MEFAIWRMHWKLQLSLENPESKCSCCVDAANSFPLSFFSKDGEVRNQGFTIVRALRNLQAPTSSRRKTTRHQIYLALPQFHLETIHVNWIVQLDLYHVRSFSEFSGWPSGQERNGSPRSPSRPSLDNCMGIWRRCLKDAGCPCLGIEGLHRPAYSSSNTRCRNVGLFNVVTERPETSQPLARHRRSLSRMWTISGGTT